MENVPAIIRALSREEAIIMMADSNLHRESLLPSERAFAYKMKLEAQKKAERTDAHKEQGYPCKGIGRKP